MWVVYFSNRNTPDPIQETQGDGYSKSMIQALSAVCVRSPNYGTRSVAATSADFFFFLTLPPSCLYT